MWSTIFNAKNKIFTMLSSKEINLIYETLLSSPGMKDVIKFSFSAARKDVLVLAGIIDLGLAKLQEPGSEIMIGGTDTTEVIIKIKEEILLKSELSEMNERMKSLEARNK